VDVDLAVLDLHPEEHGRLTFMDAVFRLVLLLLQPWRERRQLPGIVQEGLQSGGTIGGLEAGD
jgi:hypothetical protein